MLSNEWDKVKSKDHPRKCWLTQVNSLKKELIPRKNVGNKTKEALDEIEHQEFEVALQHKSKSPVYNGLN